MKHLLNNIPQEEKNRILEQHRGGKSIDTTRFKALLESSMGNVKPLISEDDVTTQTTTLAPTRTQTTGTKPNTQQGVEVYKNPVTGVVNDFSNWIKVIAFSDEATTQALTNIEINPGLIGLEGNNVKFTYVIAGKNVEGTGTFDCNSTNTMHFDGKPLSGYAYISDKRVDTLKSKCGSNQGYASTNTSVDKNFS
jgi:hypothetical protein